MTQREIAQVLLVGTTIMLDACGSQTPPPASPDAGNVDAGIVDADWVPPVDAATIVFLSIVSHNEDDERYDDAYGQLVAPFGSPPGTASYTCMRGAILAIQELIQQKELEFGYEIEFDFQTDFRFLLAVEEFESSELMETTNGKNIVRYLAEDLGVAVEPHSHDCATISAAAIAAHPEYADGCNVADVAKLLADLGVTAEPVVGGYLVNPSTNATWERYWTPLPGRVFQSFEWQAEILWGGGSSMHLMDPKLTGIWRPAGELDYIHDDPERQLTVIANGGGTTLESLVQAIQQGRAPGGRAYAFSHMVFELDVCTRGADALVRFEELLDEADPYVRSGLVVYASISETVERWRSEYASEPNVYDFTCGMAGGTTCFQGESCAGDDWLEASQSWDAPAGAEYCCGSSCEPPH